MRVYDTNMLQKLVILLPDGIYFGEERLDAFLAFFADEYYIVDGEWKLSEKGRQITKENVDSILIEMGYKL